MVRRHIRKVKIGVKPIIAAVNGRSIKIYAGRLPADKMTVWPNEYSSVGPKMNPMAIGVTSKCSLRAM